MGKYVKMSLLLVLFIITNKTTLANSAQPGFWDAGGTGSFSLLYPEDSAAYKKVQMVRELVAIQLYPGYAVVKGTYWMHNTTSDSLSFKAGYPLDGHYEAQTEDYSLMNIAFDSLYNLDVKVNGNSAIIYRAENETSHGWGYDLWHTFQVQFAPTDTVIIEVYFILNTNNTTISAGYDRHKTNGFIYLLETGATWKQPIVQGEVRLQMMGGLTIDDVVGMAPDSVMQLDKATQTIVYRFINLEPNHDSNIVVAYGEQIEDFDFSVVVAQSEALYNAIDALYKQDSAALLEPIVFGNPFAVHSTNWGANLIFMAIVFGPPILLIVFVVLLFWWIYKRYKK